MGKHDEDAAWRALCAYARNPVSSADPREPWEIPTTPRSKIKKRQRKMTVQRAVKQANKAGLAVHGVIVKADGVELQLDQSSQNANIETNPWDQVQ